jgi:hypothetical protein
VLNASLGPVYLREGTPIPGDVASERVLTIKHVFLDPPEQPQEQLPEVIEPSPSFTRPLANPPLGIV